jgi:hypothetical protein
MSRRSGQNGNIEVRNGMYYGRYYVDVAGEEVRQRKRVPIGSTKEFTKSEAKRKLKELLESEGINATNLRTVALGQTFAEKAAWWSTNKLAMRSLSYQETREINLRKHLVPYFGKMPVSTITDDKAQEFITYLTGTGLARATIESIVSTLKAVLTEKITRDWNLVLRKELEPEQRYFTPEEMLKIVRGSKREVEAVLCSAVRIGVEVWGRCGIDRRRPGPPWLQGACQAQYLPGERSTGKVKGR